MSPHKHKLILAALSLVSAGIIILANFQYGVEIGFDSVWYISAARNLADGNGYVIFDNSPLIVKPPLYPILLETIGFLTRMDPLVAANIINPVLFGLIVYISGLLFLKVLPSSPILAFLGTASLIVSLPLVEISSMARSDLLFVFLLVLCLFFLYNYLETKNTKPLLFLSLSVALACLARYVGVVLILTGALSILLTRYDNPKAKYTHFLIFSFISTLPLAIWAVRNFVISGTLFGGRAAPLYTLSENISFAFYKIMHWYLPDRFIFSRPILVLMSVILGFMAGVSFALANAPIKTLIKQTRPFLVGLFLVVIGYTAFLIISSTTTYYDQIDNRLLAPIAVPLNLLLFPVIEATFKPFKTRFAAKTIDLLVAGGIILCLLYPARTTAAVVNYLSHEGSGYLSRSWRNSATIQYLRENDLSDCTVYSNGAEAIYINIDHKVKRTPAKSWGGSAIDDLSSLEDTWPQEDPVCIVWLNRLSSPAFFTPDELISVTNIEKITHLDDGSIYLVSRK